MLKITLVGHDDDRKRILALGAKNLPVESANFLERIAGGDGVDEEKTFTGTHNSVESEQQASSAAKNHLLIFFLTSYVKDVKH